MVGDRTTTVLDAGALIAVERGAPSMNALVTRSAQALATLVVPGPVLSRAWRGGARQALLARFLDLPLVEIDLLSRAGWQSVGVLCGHAGTRDVVDGAVVICARQRGAGAVVTSDPDGLRQLDPGLHYWTP